VHEKSQSPLAAGFGEGGAAAGVLATAGIGDLIAALGMRQAISELVLLARLIALVLPMRTTPLGSPDQVQAVEQVAA